MVKKSSLSFFVVLGFLLSINASTPDNKFCMENFPNILNLQNNPKNPRDKAASCHSDLGAWFGFALPEKTKPESWGGFTGPLMIQQARWLGPSLIQLVITEKSGKIIPFSNPTLIYYPGRIFQSYTIPDGDVSLELIFISSQTALIKVQLDNQSDDPHEYRISWKGDVFLEGTTLELDKNRIKVLFKDRPQYMIISGNTPLPLQPKIEKNRKAYRLTTQNAVSIPPGSQQTAFMTVSLFQSSHDEKREGLSRLFSKPEFFFKENHRRWHGYIQAILGTKSPYLKNPSYQNIAVKCLETLINNWKSPLGDLTHDGLVPSYHPGYFDGFWSWDSWKHAVALVHFDPQLAKDQVRTMFSFQDEHGMIPDVIYAKKAENNLRDTKPPLSAWAVWKIFEKTADKDFISEMYPKLIRYHRWWYRDRDHDRNGLCEYGSTDGTLEAAK